MTAAVSEKTFTFIRNILNEKVLKLDQISFECRGNMSLPVSGTWTYQAYLKNRLDSGKLIERKEAFLVRDIESYLGGKIKRTDAQNLKIKLCSAGGVKQLLDSKKLKEFLCKLRIYEGRKQTDLERRDVARKEEIDVSTILFYSLLPLQSEKGKWTFVYQDLLRTRRKWWKRHFFNPSSVEVTETDARTDTPKASIAFSRFIFGHSERSDDIFHQILCILKMNWILNTHFWYYS